LVAHQTYCEARAQGPASRGSRRRCPRTRQRTRCRADAPRAHPRDGRACPDTSQQVWCARHPDRPALHTTATVGLAPTRRNRFGALDIAVSQPNLVAFVGHKALERGGLFGGTGLVAHQTYCEARAQGPASRGSSGRCPRTRQRTRCRADAPRHRDGWARPNTSQ
jgi:hypothetical protein